MVVPLVNLSLDNVLFKVKPSLHQAFLQVIDITNLCFVHTLLYNTPSFVIYRSISMKLYDTSDAIFFGNIHCTTTTTTTILRPFFRDHPGEPVPEQNFWTLWCKGRLTEADTQTIRLVVTPYGLNSAHLYHPPFFTGRMPFLPHNQQCQSTVDDTVHCLMCTTN